MIDIESAAFCTTMSSVFSPDFNVNAGVKKVPSSRREVCIAEPPLSDTLTLVAFVTLPWRVIC
ncbi:hypothetical protein D3C76_1623140 [compost metagenome]